MQSSSLLAGVSTRRFPVAIDYHNKSRTITHPVCTTLDFPLHLPLATGTVNSDRLSRQFPQGVKRLVKLLDDACHKCPVTEPILDQDAERFFGESDGIFGLEFVCGPRGSRHSHRPTVRLDSPGSTLDRCNEH